MIIYSAGKYQDTIRTRTNLQGDSLKLDKKPLQQIVGLDIVDTTVIQSGNIIAGSKFHNPSIIFTAANPEPNNSFPFVFIEKTRQIKTDSRNAIIKYLRIGEELPKKQFSDDWIIGILLLISFLYSLVQTSSRSSRPGLVRFFSMRGINDPASRDIDSIFQWQAAIHNLASFLITALFIYCTATTFDLLGNSYSGFIYWIIFAVFIVAAITIRHIVCLITGTLSGLSEVFREYLVTIYLSYRFSALILLVLVILMTYTPIFTANTWIIAGFFVFGLMYLIRIFRLLLIFMNRNISIFYLILYLCALEILPVLISVKYFTGLI